MQKIRLITGGAAMNRAFFNQYHKLLKGINEEPHSQRLLAALNKIVNGSSEDDMMTPQSILIASLLEDYKSPEFKKLFNACFYEHLGVFVYQYPAPTALLSNNQEFLTQDAEELTLILIELSGVDFDLLTKLKMGNLSENELLKLGKLGLTDDKNQLLKEVKDFVEWQLTIGDKTISVTPVVRFNLGH